MKTRTSMWFAICMLLAGCASQQTMTAKQQMSVFQAAAGKPVGFFSYIGPMYSWQPLSQNLLAVYVHPHKAYLLNVAPCPDLKSAITIGVTSSFGQVRSGADNVVLGSGFPSRCPIERIRPLNMKALHVAKKIKQREIDALPRKADQTAAAQSS